MPRKGTNLIESYQVEGFKVGKTILNKADFLTVDVKDPKVVDQGFFSSTFVCYQVRTQPLGKEVERRDGDFNILREYLKCLYPFLLIPPITEPLQKKDFDNVNMEN